MPLQMWLFQHMEPDSEVDEGGIVNLVDNMWSDILSGPKPSNF